MATIAEILFTTETTASQQAKFVLAMRLWRPEILKEFIVNAPLSEQKKFVNKWLADMENLFRENSAKINILAAYKGVIATGAMSIDEFLEIYRARITSLTSQDLAWARLQRNNLGKRMAAKGVKKFYDDWNDFLLTARARGLTRREQVQMYMNTTALKETTLIDRAGRFWKPDNYAVMYSNTRDSQLRDEFFQDQTIRLGRDVVQVSDHGTTTPICKLFEGKYYSLTGATSGLPILPQRPPFHPNCKHVLVRPGKVSKKEIKQQNFFKNKDIKKEQAGWTDGQKKTVVKQTAWNKKNRPTKAQV